MGTEGFRFILWVENPDGTWKLQVRSRLRRVVEAAVANLPATARWRFVSIHEGLLAESMTRA